MSAPLHVVRRKLQCLKRRVLEHVTDTTTDIVDDGTIGIVRDYRPNPNRIVECMFDNLNQWLTDYAGDERRGPLIEARGPR